MKKIVVFAQSNVGGAERMTVNVTKTLDRERFKVVYYLVDLSGDGKNSLTEFIPADREVHIIPKVHPLRLMGKIFRVLLREKPDTVFSSVLYLNNKILPMRTLFPGIKFIIRCENYLFTFSPKQHRMIKMTYHKADLIIAQTEEMKQELVEQMGIADGKVVVMQNPIDRETVDRKVAEGENPFPEDGKRHFVAVGRFAHQKGFDLLVRAFAEVAQAQPDSELHFVGNTGGEENPVWQEVLQLATELGVAERVHYEGYQNNPYRYMKHADCFVLSSRWEGLPNVLIEALYLGTPAAAFACIPVIGRIITEGENGYVAEKENPSALAAAMLKAVRLGRIRSAYRSASIEDFHYIFEHDRKPELVSNELQINELGGG